MNLRTKSCWLWVFVIATRVSCMAGEPGFVPNEGYVPTAEAAIKIAVAVWEPIYGSMQIAAEKPYRATLKDGVWTVQGSLPGNTAGGTALAEISKADGRILRVIHGK